MPRFDLPELTRPVGDVLAEQQIELEPQLPLPALVEPEPGTLAGPSSQPLVPVVHRRIRTLSNYWHSGWDNAVATTLLREEVLRRLCRAVEGLAPRWGFAVFDAWRPLELQQELYTNAYSDPDLPPGFLAEPSIDPATPPPHLTGGAVDLTLTLDGTAMALGSGFDDITTRAHAAHLEPTPSPAREARRMLYHHMHNAGFIIFEGEWWHFEYGTIRWSAITGKPAMYGPASP